MHPITFEMIITALTVAAAFSLMVERLVEALKNIIESGGSMMGGADATITRIKTAARLIQNIGKNISANDPSPNEIAEAIEHALAENDSGQFSMPTAAQEEIENESAFETHSSIAIKKLLPMTEANLDWCRLQMFYQLAALAIGIMIASVTDIHLLSMLLLKNELLATEQLTLAQQSFLFFDELLTGLVIAGGSQPIHVLLRFLTTRKPPPELSVTMEDESEEVKVMAVQSVTAGAPAANPAALSLTSMTSFITSTVPSSPTDTGGWIPIEYQGGVKPETLQTRNFRPQDPNLIVFHHTGMSSNLRFQAVVDEFLINKGWSTGYHCVIMPNGTIRPFCRWDRVGNHTKGLNQRSLGVAFHGNFHLDPTDRYSNHDGRFGIQQPTKEQLQAGARLMALWVHLYNDIELDFDTHILPHRKAKPGYTVCPGSHFPIQDLQKQVTGFYEQWSQSPYAMERITEFKLRPYLYKEGIAV